MKEVTITISGPAGSGKSQLAWYLAGRLQALGVQVTLNDDGHEVSPSENLKPNWLPKVVAIATKESK